MTEEAMREDWQEMFQRRQGLTQGSSLGARGVRGSLRRVG